MSFAASNGFAAAAAPYQQQQQQQQPGQGFGGAAQLQLGQGQGQGGFYGGAGGAAAGGEWFTPTDAAYAVDAAGVMGAAAPWGAPPAQTLAAQAQPMVPMPPHAQAHVHAPVTSVGFDAAAASTFAAGGQVRGGGLSRPEYENEPPLLVELGIDFSHIRRKTMSALTPMRSLDAALMSDGDLAGPFVFCFALGFLLMLTGKLHFGYVFGFGVVGCLAMWLLLNLLTQKENGIEVHVVVSVLGYALLPIVLLSAVQVLVHAAALAPFAVGWCTVTATRFFESALDARDQRWLIAYPVFLLFACFALITVF